MTIQDNLPIHHGHHEFQMMPFGLTKVPSTPQGTMNQIFKSYLRKFLLVLFDDTLIYNEIVDEHSHHLKKIQNP